MVDKVKKPSVFERGSTWLRSDFHLHTKADKEFNYSGEEDYYYSNYIERLKNTGIHVGLICNHNKFDLDEFNALCKTAKNQDIFYLDIKLASQQNNLRFYHTS